ncbi:MAG TPA: hypothetical protein VFC47_12625 [Caulobacteraceae bacterium]|nr:hypothetical protein [Caulobacteraceae bacterium]
MKRLLLLALLASVATPAAACVPPPGLGFQQWYAMCRNDMESGYARFFAGSQSHASFMRSMYQRYQSARPTYNPALRRQQDEFADTMARRQGNYMEGVRRQGENRTNDFNNQQRAKSRQQENEMMYIQNERCVRRNSDGSCRYKVPN